MAAEDQPISFSSFWYTWLCFMESLQPHLSWVLLPTPPHPPHTAVTFKAGGYWVKKYNKDVILAWWAGVFL